MSLRDEITADIAEAFDDDLADAISRFSGKRFEPTGPFDPITQTQPGEWIEYEGRGVFGGFGIQVSEALGILRTDVKLTVLQSEIASPPKTDDEIQRDEGQYALGFNSGSYTEGENVAIKYRVIHVGQDPVAATWILQIRRV